MNDAARRRTTVTMAVAAVVLALLLAAEVWFVYGTDDPEVTSQRPVTTGTVAHRTAVAAAARSTTEILSYGYEDFDAQIDAAADEMTATFAQEFRETTAGVRTRFSQQRMTQEVRVVATAVVTASDERVEALLFLERYVARAGRGTEITPYRALVTVVRDERGGWLVSDMRIR